MSLSVGMMRQQQERINCAGSPPACRGRWPSSRPVQVPAPAELDRRLPEQVDLHFATLQVFGEHRHERQSVAVQPPRLEDRKDLQRHQDRLPGAPLAYQELGEIDARQDRLETVAAAVLEVPGLDLAQPALALLGLTLPQTDPGAQPFEARLDSELRIVVSKIAVGVQDSLGFVRLAELVVAIRLRVPAGQLR